MQKLLVETLKRLFNRDLNKLKEEIESYGDERNMWEVSREISNSAGNLCLHLIGNLNTYIGAEIGKNGYIRQRDLEFSLKNIPRAELIAKIGQTKIEVDAALNLLTDEQLKEEYSAAVFKENVSTEYVLVHLVTHLAYHLGQINYHRRLLDK
ncbi:MAG: DinB family protein [Chitinophagales bacterium]|nr:DinB family protein [Chitinophagales bacterium]